MTQFFLQSRTPVSAGSTNCTSRYIYSRQPLVPVKQDRSASQLSQPRTLVSQHPTLATFLIDGPVLPLMTDAILVADSLRRAVMSRFGNWCQRNPQQAETFRRIDQPDSFASPVFSGRELDGTELTGHGHARFLALPLAQDQRRVGLLAVVAEDGFGPAEVGALSGLQFLKIGAVRDDSQQEFRVQLVGLGDAGKSDLACCGHSSEWVSVTPFLGHADIGEHKQTQWLRKGLRREWRRFIEQRPELRDVELLDVIELTPDEMRTLQLPAAREFRRLRSKHGGRDAWRPGALFRLSFSQPIQGPLCLGYASHFGMGVFHSGSTLRVEELEAEHRVTH